MKNLVEISFIILSLLKLSPHEPLPNEHGLIQDYGFEQNDSQQFVPINRLVQSGAYKVIEIDDHSDTSIYFVSLQGDSITFEEQTLRGNKLGAKITQIFSASGKLLYDLSSTFLGYYNSDGSWTKYKHLYPARYNNRIDTTILLEKILFDKYERPLEKDRFDEYEEFRDYGKIAEKTIYSYSGNEIIKKRYQRNYQGHPYPGRLSSHEDSIRWQQEFISWKEKRLNGPIEYILMESERKIIDSISRSIEIESATNDYGGSPILKTKNLIQYDMYWNPVKENKEIERVTITEEKIDYIRNESGLLLSKIVTFSDSSKGEPEVWSYDKHGNCESHEHGNSRETWTYDEKGNLIQYNSGSYVNEFKIYYK